MTDLEWANKVADKHGIQPETVLEIRRNAKESRKRTEEFLDLYFEGRNDNGNTNRIHTEAAERDEQTRS